VLGLIGVNDLIRPEAYETLAELWRLGIRRTLLLTGDSAASAELVARELELAEYRGEMFPEDKFALVSDLKRAGHRVAMVGDGINDAPSLALADLGIAMGTAGSDVAVEAADVALARDDIRDVATVLDLSRHTLGVVRQNYALSLGVNAGGIIIGALGALNPILAALLHNLSTIAVVGNSARLIRYGRLPAEARQSESPPSLAPGRSSPADH
jgi:manganese-transporting P-type ATPase C